MIQFLKKLNPFQKKQDMVVSMQITDELVRFVGLKNSTEGVFVYLFGEQYFSEGVMQEGKIINPGSMTQTLSAIAKTYNLKKVHVVLPEEQSFTFHSVVTKSDNSKEVQSIIEDHIVSYLKLHTKLPVKDLVCEYDVTGQENDSYEISVWVTPRSIVDAYVEVFESAGLEAVTLECGSQVVTNACIDASGKETCLLVDFGHTKTHVAVTSEGAILHSATIPVGEYALTPKIQDYLNVSRGEAEKIKHKYGLLRSHKEPALLSELIHEISPLQDYLDRTYIDWFLRPYKTKKERNPITRVVLHGEGSHILGLRDHLSQATSLPTHYANVWRNVNLPKDRAPEVSFEDSLRYATALSCALHVMKEE
jgi:type IV pilus assembly protein PilM